MNPNRIGEMVVANLFTVGILIGVATLISIEVKRELFLNGTTKTNYTIVLA